ncbi:helix-turn-helix transcriptional regulator [Streptacidiphilus rugosus]|uniref:helix-turn-helix transcriptional regulator n=1 Tax=Streptacidiphilus rugosus TaxID=405783 RepID=UPI00056C035E|nr:helix-turn-helix transcriptional regulator [Streptacidiphilus rugosus]
MEQSLFESSSLEATEAFLSSAYTTMRISGRETDDTRARVSRQALPTVSVDQLSLGYDMGYDAGCLGKVALVTVESGSLVDRSEGREEVFGPGETFLVAPPDRPYRGVVRSARYTVTMLDPALLDRVARGGSHGARVDLTDARAVTPAAGRRLTSAVGYLRDQVLTDFDASASELVVSTALQHLAAVVLTTLPNTSQTPPTRTDSLDAGYGTLRRAEAFIDDNAHRDISLADIAAAACVTPRALQYAFRRHADTTPLAYLRRVRLARAHEELASSNPQRTTVTAVALRWGFLHQGRFAAAYRQAYGVAPSLTLRDR